MRTANKASEIVQEMVAERLTEVEDSAEYAAALETIANLQNPVLEELSTVVRDMLTDFLPDVSAVEVQLSQDARRAAFRQTSSIVVDDGSATDLGLKGDGVQSLAALSIIRHVAASDDERSELVLCIEEPEAHLHPRAIHRLAGVLGDIAARQQVVVTTHSPLLINRNDLARNIIVQASRAKPATSVSQLREVLGVRLSDNLQSALLALVVEGENDRTALMPILQHRSEVVRLATADGGFAIETLTGGGNLIYRLTSLTEAFCRFHVFLDSDHQAISKADEAELLGLLAPADRTFAVDRGRAESEFEDLLNLDVYADDVVDVFNVDLRVGPFQRSNKKWSVRVQEAFRAAGQRWTEATLGRVKALVAEQVAAEPGDAIHPDHDGVIESLTRAIERKLRSRIDEIPTD